MRLQCFLVSSSLVISSVIILLDLVAATSCPCFYSFYSPLQGRNMLKWKDLLSASRSKASHLCRRWGIRHMACSLSGPWNASANSGPSCTMDSTFDLRSPSKRCRSCGMFRARFSLANIATPPSIHGSYTHYNNRWHSRN
ncbi:hypothetical protein COCON_G00010190, partial [Conger conger]